MQGTCAQGLDTSFIALGYSKVAVLGVVQGITELMPISSTAHMRIVPALLGWPDPGSAFSAAMQLAALAAVVSYFWVDVEIPGGRCGRRSDPARLGGPPAAARILDWHIDDTDHPRWVGPFSRPQRM